MKKIDTRHEIWAEKYRPQCIEDMILPESVRIKFDEFVNKGQIPNLLFNSNTPGLGKSAITNSLLKDINAEVLWINGSKEGNIDTLRGRISSFASSGSFMGEPKTVVIDECLEENEEILIKIDGKIVPFRIGDLEYGIEYQCVSVNMETGELEDDILTLHSEKEDDIYEIELSDGRTIRCNKDHPFFVGNELLKISTGLKEGDEIKCLLNLDL